MRFNIPTQSEMDLPLSELCEGVNPPRQRSKRYGRSEVGTYAHLHAPHALSVLVSIGAKGGIRRDKETV